MVNELEFADELIDNGVCEITMCRNLNDYKMSYAVKYDHLKFIKGFVVESEMKPHPFHGPSQMEEEITRMVVGSTYAKSILDFIKCDSTIYFGIIEEGLSHYYDMETRWCEYKDGNRYSYYIDPSESDSFKFFLNMRNYYPDGKHNNIITSRKIFDNGYIVMQNESTPACYDPETFFKNYQLYTDQILPKYTISLYNIDTEQYIKIRNFISDLNIIHTSDNIVDMSEKDRDLFLQMNAEYQRRKNELQKNL